MATKADKLIARGSETPEVANAAERVSEMLIRLYMNQPRHFAETVMRAVPGFTKADAEKLRSFFRYVADYFDAEASDRPYPPFGHAEQIRRWGADTDNGCYNLLRVFAVLACPFDYCPDNPECWETRRAFCAMDKPKTQAASKEVG